MILAGDGVKSITGAVLDSPVAAAIVGSSVEVLPATAQALTEESTYIKGGWFRSSKTIKTQRHTSTPVGAKITAPRAIVGTTDAAGTARLQVPEVSGTLQVAASTIELPEATTVMTFQSQKHLSHALANRVTTSTVKQVTNHAMSLEGVTTMPHQPDLSRTICGPEPAPLPALTYDASVGVAALPAPRPALLTSTASPASPTASETALVRSSSSAPSPASPASSSSAVVASPVRVPYTPAAPVIPRDIAPLVPTGNLGDMTVHLSVTDAVAARPEVQEFIQRTGARVTRVEDTYEDERTSHTTLSAPLSLALSIGLNFVLPGGGALLTAANAVAATLIPRFVNGLVMHGDLGKALGECVTGKALRAVVLSLVAPRGGAPAGSLDLVQHFVSGLQNALARLPFEYALGEADFRTCLTSGLLGAASDAVTGFAASHIGDLSHPGGFSQGGIPVPVSLGLHAVNGAAGAAIRGEDPLSGACGAALGEAAGMLYHHVRMRGLQRGTEEYDRAMSFGVDTARMAATLAAIPLGLDADTAARAAGIAAENNAMMALPAAATRALAEVTDSPLLQEAADQMEELDQALDRFDESREMLDDIADMATRQAVSGWNEAIQGAQEVVSRGERQIEAGWAIQREAFAANGINIGDPPTGGAKILRTGMGMVRLPETGTELAAELAIIAGTAGLGKAVRAAFPVVSPYISRLAAKIGQSRSFVPSHVLERAIASKTGTPLTSFGAPTASDLAAARFARASSSGTNGRGTIVGTLTRVESSFHVPGGGPIRTTPATVTPKAPAPKPASLSSASSTSGGSSSGPSVASQTSSQFWTKTTHFKGNKVYQRDDLIDIHKIDKDGMTNLQRMREGLAPIGPDNRSMELHHMLQTNESAIAEMTSKFHRKNKRVIHINPTKIKSGINRTRFDTWRENYWKNRSKDFEG